MNTSHQVVDPIHMAIKGVHHLYTSLKLSEFSNFPMFGSNHKALSTADVWMRSKRLAVFWIFRQMFGNISTKFHLNYHKFNLFPQFFSKCHRFGTTFRSYRELGSWIFIILHVSSIRCIWNSFKICHKWDMFKMTLKVNKDFWHCSTWSCGPHETWSEDWTDGHEINTR